MKKEFLQVLQETGKVVEEVAQQTVNEALKEEADNESEIEVSVDGGWQKRGCGRAYDSLSGHCTMIGCKSGKVVGYAVRCKNCRTCEESNRTGQLPGKHDCRRNWAGSAKGMESDMVVEMLQTFKRKGITTKAIVGDDDTSTISKVKAKVDSSISKKSDKNHVRKTVSSLLYELRKRHKSLSNQVIRYILKLFNYMISQNKNNREGMVQGLQAISNHPFGIHTYCQDWCSKKENTNSRYSSLPYGKPLSDALLQTDLKQIFNGYLKHAERLCNLGSTQANESLNKTIASKAPKQLHFSGSASLNYRVAASVAQKNIGQKYLLHVNRKIGLSPGTSTARLAVLRDLAARKRRAIATTYKAKRQRLLLKQKRKQKAAEIETREGATYEPNVDWSIDSHDTEMIPIALEKPIARPIPADNIQPIYFDLETTGLGRSCHITQIACKREDEMLNIYVKPKVSISQAATDVTDIYFLGNQMYHGSSPVTAVSISNALHTSIDFLRKSRNNVLVGHNVKTFDSHVLVNALHSCGKVNEFSQVCLGFLDTKSLFKKSHPHIKPHSQEALVKNILNITYKAHDAKEDVSVLQKLVSSLKSSDSDKLFASFPLSYTVQMHSYLQMVSSNLPSLEKLTTNKIVSQEMAKRIAGSGLKFQHLMLAFKRKGHDGIEQLFREKTENKKVRVTNSKKIIGSVADYLEKLLESS